MGDLVKAPHSEITATLEVLDRWGVEPQHLTRFRKASSYVQSMIAQAIIRCDDKFFAKAEHPVFKTIVLNRHISAMAYEKALKSADCQVSGCASDILKKVGFELYRGMEFDLVVLSVAELGFPNGATRDQIYARAHERGLSFCPAEVGPALRLAYSDQPASEWLIIAMEPITDSDGIANVFRVVHEDGDRWLSTSWIRPDDAWGATFRWVFWRK